MWARGIRPANRHKSEPGTDGFCRPRNVRNVNMALHEDFTKRKERGRYRRRPRREFELAKTGALAPAEKKQIKKRAETAGYQRRSRVRVDLISMKVQMKNGGLRIRRQGGVVVKKEQTSPLRRRQF